MAGYTSNVTPWDLVVVNFIQGVGWSFLFVPLTAATFSTLDPRHMDVAAGLYGLIGNLGKSVGVSILVGFYVRDSQANRAELIGHVSPFNEAVRHTPLPEFWNMDGLSSLAALNAEVTRQANLMAYTNDFRLLTFIILACVPLVLLMRRTDTQKKQKGTDDVADEQVSEAVS
jgi:DHA2 family multidrug resistance protein